MANIKGLQHIVVRRLFSEWAINGFLRVIHWHHLCCHRRWQQRWWEWWHRFLSFKLSITLHPSPFTPQFRCDLVWFHLGLALYYLVSHGTTWFGMVLFGLAWHYLVWHGLIWYRIISCQVCGSLLAGPHPPSIDRLRHPHTLCCFLSSKYPSFKWPHLFFLAFSSLNYLHVIGVLQASTSSCVLRASSFGQIQLTIFEKGIQWEEKG